MKVLVACEESQAVAMAFRNKGHEAYSCDIQECSGGYPEYHICDDALKVMMRGVHYTQTGKIIVIEKWDNWDLMIGHPVCKFLSNAGNGYFNFMRYQNARDRWEKRLNAVDFFMKLWNAPIGKICLENPVGFINSFFPATQTINPSFFGEPENKRTCLWLKGLPKLYYNKTDTLFGNKTLVDVEPTYIDKGGKPRYFTDAISGGRKTTEKERLKTFLSIANAMADQWG